MSSTGSSPTTTSATSCRERGALLGRGDPDFFKGTVVEKAAAEVLTRRAHDHRHRPLPATAHIDHAACREHFHKIAPGFST